ncbi:hypothetical protein [Streptomyces mirabilis]|uniref:hypothetical protein n=1 Tax=Streptomyces mirabilis TaxID=68239 RepID=UPI0036B7574B
MVSIERVAVPWGSLKRYFTPPFARLEWTLTTISVSPAKRVVWPGSRRMSWLPSASYRYLVVVGLEPPVST